MSSCAVGWATALLEFVLMLHQSAIKDLLYCPPQALIADSCCADLGVRVMGVVQPNVRPQQKCYVLGYNQGYANLSSVHYLAIKNTANKGACCNLCLRDNRCVAWTRVAGECRTPFPVPHIAVYRAATLHTLHGVKW